MPRWATDASQIDVKDIDSLLYRNRGISEFLSDDGRLFLSANKGLGKTLLMTYKRYSLAENVKVQGVRLLPEDAPFLDMMDDVHTLSKEHLDFLSRLENADRLWSVALRTAACTHYLRIRHPNWRQSDPADLRALLPKEFWQLPAHLTKWLTSNKVLPSIICQDLLRLSLKELNQVIDESQTNLSIVFATIESGLWMFLDKVDQAFAKATRAAWINVQAGLIEAASRLYQVNKHVRVYATIRQEAFANYASPTKNNTRGFATEIKYEDGELEALLNGLTWFYEKRRSFKEFVGFENVHNRYGDQLEDTFQYVRRHTLGRPRDLVIIAGKMPTPVNESEFRNTVNSASSTDLVSGVFDEMRVFLEILRSEDERNRLWKLIPSNIISKKQLERVCALFNGLEALGDNDLGVLKHPCCELFNAGLLGYVDSAVVNHPHSMQRFKQPYDKIYGENCGLPKHPAWYLVHPGLHDLILGANSAYRVYRYVVVGHGYEWKPWFLGLMRTQDNMDSLSRALKDEVEDLIRRCAQHWRDPGNEGKQFVPARWRELRLLLEQAKATEVQVGVEQLMRGR